MTGLTSEQELVLVAKAVLEYRDGVEGEGTRYVRALVAAADVGRRGQPFGQDADPAPVPKQPEREDVPAPVFDAGEGNEAYQRERARRAAAAVGTSSKGDDFRFTRVGGFGS